MYEIILKTWYAETPSKIHEEVYRKLIFKDIESALKYLSENYETIIENFPVLGIRIEHNNKIKVVKE